MRTMANTGPNNGVHILGLLRVGCQAGTYCPDRPRGINTLSQTNLRQKASITTLQLRPYHTNVGSLAARRRAASRVFFTLTTEYTGRKDPAGQCPAGENFLQNHRVGLSKQATPFPECPTRTYSHPASRIWRRGDFTGPKAPARRLNVAQLERRYTQKRLGYAPHDSAEYTALERSEISMTSRLPASPAD